MPMPSTGLPKAQPQARPVQALELAGTQRQAPVASVQVHAARFSLAARFIVQQAVQAVDGPDVGGASARGGLAVAGIGRCV